MVETAAACWPGGFVRRALIREVPRVSIPDFCREVASMEASSIYDQLTGIFRDVFDDEDLVVTPEMTAADVEEWDSLNHIKLVLSVEKNFGLRFSAAEVGSLVNVGEFVNLIQSKKTA
jgi:acyl carrier protein